MMTPVSDGPDHDYDPAWDYDVVAAPEEARVMLDRVDALVRAQVLPALGLSNMRIFFVGTLDGVLARYCSGTSSFPFIVVDFEALRSACEHYGLDIETQLAATIAHELAHAVQESLGIEEHGDHQEDEAEDFARKWVTEGIVDPTCITAGDEPLSGLREG